MVITCTVADVARTAPQRDEAYNNIVATGVAPGHALYQLPADGALVLTSATASGTAGFRGIALEVAVASGTVSYLRRGRLYGFDLSGMNYDDPIYLSNTAGMLDTAPGDVSVLVGRVMRLNEPGGVKVAYFDAELASASDLG